MRTGAPFGFIGRRSGGLLRPTGQCRLGFDEARPGRDIEPPALQVGKALEQRQAARQVADQVQRRGEQEVGDRDAVTGKDRAAL